jgi:opacity protein-like surface antigen
MKKVLAIVLLVLAFSLVSVPAFAQQVELDLKLWYPGVVGADEWVADYGTYDFEAIELHGVSVLQWEPPPHKDENELVLRPGSGLSFILSGEYFILPSISVGGSYWGLSRVDEVGVELETNWESETPELHWVQMPWMEDELRAFEWSKVVVAGKETLSMSALDVHATKTFSGPGWEAGLSGGVRRAAFNEHLSTELGIVFGDEKVTIGTDSKLNVSAIGPHVGIAGSYTLADNLALKAGAKAGLLFGTAQTEAMVKILLWDYDPEALEWILDEESTEGSQHEATDAIRITTFDLSAALAYQITEQWSVEAGYYASIWKGVPSVLQLRKAQSGEATIAQEEDPSLWEQPEARTITVRGLTLGVNFKF